MKFLEALKVGHSLEDPVFWKKAQNLLNLISGSSALIIIIVPSLKEYLTPDNMIAVGAALAALNAYFTSATSDKVGL